MSDTYSTHAHAPDSAAESVPAIRGRMNGWDKEGSAVWWRPPHLLALGLAVVLGAAVRLWLVLSSDFPLHDGGLFYAMVQDLKRSHYALPLYTTYNSLHIPFSYPPLAFYIAASVSDLSGWPLIHIFRFVPLIFSIATIPAFYLLGQAILLSNEQTSLAVIAFALLPLSFEWPIRVTLRTV